MLDILAIIGINMCIFNGWILMSGYPDMFQLLWRATFPTEDEGQQDIDEIYWYLYEGQQETRTLKSCDKWSTKKIQKTKLSLNKQFGFGFLSFFVKEMAKKQPTLNIEELRNDECLNLKNF